MRLTVSVTTDLLVRPIFLGGHIFLCAMVTLGNAQVINSKKHVNIFVLICVFALTVVLLIAKIWGGDDDSTGNNPLLCVRLVHAILEMGVMTHLGIIPPFVDAIPGGGDDSPGDNPSLCVCASCACNTGGEGDDDSTGDNPSVCVCPVQAILGGRGDDDLPGDNPCLCVRLVHAILEMGMMTYLGIIPLVSVCQCMQYRGGEEG